MDNSVGEQEFKNYATLIYNVLHKRFQTTYIYALAQTEKAFGHLWGEDVPEDTELTPAQEFNLVKFEELRKQILDQGNKQFRRAIEEVLGLVNELKENQLEQ